MDAEANEKCELSRDMQPVVNFYCLRWKTPRKRLEKWNLFTVTIWQMRTNDRKISKNEKCIAGYFASLFSHFVPLFSLFIFRSILRQGRHLREKSKDFVVYFSATLIKHEIRMKYEKCIVSVSYFVACFAKTFAKYEKCITSLMISEMFFRLFRIILSRFFIISFFQRLPKVS